MKYYYTILDDLNGVAPERGLFVGTIKSAVFHFNYTLRIRASYTRLQFRDITRLEAVIEVGPRGINRSAELVADGLKIHWYQGSYDKYKIAAPESERIRKWNEAHRNIGNVLTLNASDLAIGENTVGFYFDSDEADNIVSKWREEEAAYFSNMLDITNLEALKIIGNSAELWQTEK